MAEAVLAQQARPEQAQPQVDAERGGLGRELRTVGMVAFREVIHFSRARLNIVVNLLQPLLFLLVLGVGLNPVVGSTGGVDFMAFVFPGLLGMSIVTTAISSAASTVVDRQFGFLRMMMVAPVRRSSIALGKILGGTLTATLQGSILLVLAPLVGVRMDLQTLAAVVLVMLLLAFELAAFGVFVASFVKRIQSFSVAVQFLLLPMVLLSGAMFPLQGLPLWLSVLTRLNPLSYALDALRRVMLAGQSAGGDPSSPLLQGLTVMGEEVTVIQELAMSAVLAVGFVFCAAQALSRKD